MSVSVTQEIKIEAASEDFSLGEIVELLSSVGIHASYIKIEPIGMARYTEIGE